MDNKSTTKRMIGAVVLVLIAALLLAWLLKGKNKSVQEQQDLIADQTQEASPILGFPGVNDEDKNADGTVAQNAGDGAATEDGSYVIGAADQATDSAQQQAQNALAAGGDAAASAGQAATDGANQVAAAAAGAAAGAATQASQAGQQVANATGFQVRDSQNQDGGTSTEQRPIVENGEVKAGTGSMGGNEVAAGGTQDQQSSGDATQTASASGGSAATQASGSGDSSGSGSGSATQQAAASGDSSAGSNSGDASTPAKKVANPKLVNEKPVPAPRTQSASAGSRSSGPNDGGRSGSSSRSAASSASNASSGGDSSGAAAGGSGYAIQVLAASSRSKAEGVRKDIARDGYPAFVVRARVNGKTVYRVRVGTYPGKGTARAVQNKMKARYTKNQYVQNSFVTKN